MPVGRRFFVVGVQSARESLVLIRAILPGPPLLSFPVYWGGFWGISLGCAGAIADCSCGGCFGVRIGLYLRRLSAKSPHLHLSGT